jgi:hypothetical protein
MIAAALWALAVFRRDGRPSSGQQKTSRHAPRKRLPPLRGALFGIGISSPARLLVSRLGGGESPNAHSSNRVFAALTPI